MPAVDVFPNVEAIVGEVLRDANISGLSTRVYSGVPKTPTYPLITVKRIGGVPVERHRLDRARIQIDVWGENKGQALTIASTARSVLIGIEGQSFTDPVVGTVTAVDDDLGLTWLPDPVTDRDRYIFGVSVIAHA